MHVVEGRFEPDNVLVWQRTGLSGCVIAVCLSVVHVFRAHRNRHKENSCQGVNSSNTTCM